MNDIVKLGIQKIYDGKVRDMGRRMRDLAQIARFNELLGYEESRKQKKSAVGIVFAVIGAIVVLVGICCTIYYFFFKKDDSYDLYDDLDNYYADDDHFETTEEDFAE